ncbi:hypothetical protein KDH_12390 [Dictyobacter sp. S3.2.2.5]|uniref:Methyltransferase domain-containing protein n=1 Tax=Dictyobacter halimunensis TaxID=3026934 RepID=A0ABQ6FL55_9CHLR|nr:hypothetical protein KDH_12390 [Dictyobacter sp. S3.2.2.5]
MILERVDEMARLLEQDAIITQGRPLPEQPPETITHMTDVLELACGPGGWGLQLLQNYPHMHLVGVDLSQRMIAFVNSQAHSTRANAQFYEMDITKPLDFPEESFDLINARFISGLLLRDSWRPLVEQCKRLLRPGGILRLTECESAVTNNEAQNQMAELVTQTMYLSGRGFNATGTFGIVNRFPNFLRDAGFQQVNIYPQAIDISTGREYAKAIQQDFTMSLQLLKPFLVPLRLLPSEEAFDELLQNVIAGWENTYMGIWFLLTAWGIKQ